MKRTLLLFLLLAPLLPADTLSIREAWELALEGNPTEEASIARLEQARARLLQARGAYQPRVDLTASGSRLEYSDTQKSRIPMAPDAAEQYNAGVQVGWVLWSGGTRKAQIESLDFSLLAAEAGRLDSRETLLYEVGRAFTAAQLARENLLIAREDRDFQQALLEDSQRKEKAGLDSRTDSLNFEIRKLSAENALVAQQAGFDQAMHVLAALLGVEDDTVLPEPDALFTQEPDYQVPDPVKDWPEIRRNLPALRQADLDLKAAQAQVEAQRGQLRPEISAFGSIGVEREDDPNFSGDDVTNTIGLQLSWNVWDGGILREQVQELEAVSTEIEAGVRQAELQARSAFRQSITRLISSRQSLELTRKTRDLSQENRDLVEASYRAGRETLIRLNEAQRDFNNAGARYAASRLQLQLDYLDLLLSMGKLEAFLDTWQPEENVVE